jgi:hypothetical protein
MSTANDPDRVVTVKIFDSLTDAIAARAMLEAADIDCFLADEHTYRIAGPFHAVFGVNGVRFAGTGGRSRARGRNVGRICRRTNRWSVPYLSRSSVASFRRVGTINAAGPSPRSR